MHTRRWLAGVGAGSLLLIGGIAAGPVAGLAQDDDGGDSEQPISGTALERASAAALKYTGEGRVTDTEVGDEEGYYEVEVTLDNGNEVDVHLDEDFTVLGTEEDGVSEEDESEASEDQDSEARDEDADENEQPITGDALERAGAAALEHVGEGRVTDTEVGDEEGYYEVEVTLDDASQVDVHLDEEFNVLGTEEDSANDDD